VEHDKYLRAYVTMYIEGVAIEKYIGPIRISVQQGDISEIETDAIVNAANSDLWMGSGVAGAIKRKGGLEIEREALAQGPIKPGEAVITNAGRLNARKVVHCAGMPPGGLANQDYVRTSSLMGLSLAEKNQVSEIVFPAIGAGVGGLSVEESTHAILDAIKEHSINCNSLKSVILVGYSESSSQEIETILEHWGDEG